MQALGKTLNIKTTFAVKQVIAFLEQHLAAHKKEYAEAKAIYTEKVAEKLRILAAEADKQATKGYNLKEISADYSAVVSLKVPVDATEMYEQYIAIFKQSTSKDVELSMEDANCLINDAWDWAQSAKTTNSFYSNLR